MSKQLFNSILIKKEGVWKHTLSIKETEYNNILDELPEGSRIDMTIEVGGKNATYSQIKKIHAMIRQLANDSGGDFDDLKIIVKKNSGLCVNDNCKSFGDCDIEELNGAMQACIKIGDFIGSNLR